VNRYSAIGAVLLVVGLALFVGGTYASLQQEDRLAELHRVNGTVHSTSVEPIDSGFYPNVTYRYAVEGTSYTHDEVFPDRGRRPMSQADAEEVVNRYAEGDTVTVFVDAEDPTDAALRAPRSPTPIFAFGFGILALAFGFLFAVAGRQRGMDPVVVDEVTLPGIDPNDAEGDVEHEDAEDAENAEKDGAGGSGNENRNLNGNGNEDERNDETGSELDG
jgi:hypothetical protein